MVREGRGRIKDRSSTKHPKVFIYVPTEVARDTSFPFDWVKGEDVLVRIDGKKLIVEKERKE
ncbi:MAG: hypothetical protein H3Z52_03635 [archaeon]|nr:hypothetical protein [archaeon]